MLQRLPIVLAQVKAGNNTSENLLNNIRQLYLCIEEKKVQKKYIII